MAQPTAYNRAYNFSNYQAQHPADPLPAGSLDEELSRVKVTLDQIRANLAIIQRDDTAIANRSVGFDQLKTEVQIGINPPAPWATTHAYVARDTVFSNSSFYICLESHVSGNFAADLAAGKWSLIASFEAATSAVSVTFDDSTADLGASTVQAAIEALAVKEANTAFALASLDGADIAFTSTGLDHTDATEVQSALSDMDAAVTAQSVPAGTIFDTARASAPTGYLLCYGQAVSRTTYSALFTAIGTVYGAGDGSTTFNIPDCRGRVTAGRDDMGGTSANRLTGQTGGLNGDVLGASGGAETHTLTEAQLPAITPAFTGDAVPGHTHTVTAGVGDASGSGGGTFLRTDLPGTRTTSAAGGHTPSGTISSFGGDEAHNNVQPTIIFNKIIKT